MNALNKDGKPLLLLRMLMISYVFTGLLLLLLAFLLFKLKLSAGQINMGVVSIYLFSCAISGFLLGKKVKVKRYLWGALMGILYFAVLFAVSMILGNPLESGTPQILTVLMLCLAGGAVGGMLS